MSRALRLAGIAWAVACVTALLGCPAAHDGYPGTACKQDSECFTGETCVMNVCTPPLPDMAMDLDYIRFDFGPLDIELPVDDGGGDGP